MKFLKQYNSLDDYKNSKQPLIHPNISLIKDSKEPCFDSFKLIDLGLPSGIKWANMNVGATKAEELGLFCLWGAKEGYRKNELPNFMNPISWKVCPFNGGNTKYDYDSVAAISGTAFPDGYLTKEYDIACISSADMCRMPTSGDVKELMDNTIYNAATVGTVEGVRLVSKINGNDIFLPYTGNYGSGVWIQPTRIVMLSSTFGYCNTANFSIGTCYIDSNGKLSCGGYANQVGIVRCVQDSKKEDNENNE